LRNIKPWAKSCVNLHLKSILQREVFGKNRSEILKTLQESKTKMVDGFRLIVKNFIPEPIFKLEQLLNDFDNSIQLLFKNATIDRESFKVFHSIFKAKKKIRRETILEMKINVDEIDFLSNIQDDD
jgi:hypothetical protein